MRKLSKAYGDEKLFKIFSNSLFKNGAMIPAGIFIYGDEGKVLPHLLIIFLKDETRQVSKITLLQRRGKKRSFIGTIRVCQRIINITKMEEIKSIKGEGEDH